MRTGTSICPILSCTVGAQSLFAEWTHEGSEWGMGLRTSRTSSLAHLLESQDQSFTLCYLCKKLSATLPWRKFQKLWLISPIFSIFSHTVSCANPSPRANSLPIIFSPLLYFTREWGSRPWELNWGWGGTFSGYSPNVGLWDSSKDAHRAAAARP